MDNPYLKLIQLAEHVWDIYKYTTHVKLRPNEEVRELKKIDKATQDLKELLPKLEQHTEALKDMATKRLSKNLNKP
jgi:hypothetical protein